MLGYQLFDIYDPIFCSALSKIVMLVFVDYFIANFVYSRVIYESYAFLNSRATSIMA